MKYLKHAVFDLFNIANNYIRDIGPEGFNETLEILSHNDLLFIGAGNRKFINPCKIIEMKGINLGFLGCYENGFKLIKGDIFINKIDESVITKEIKDLKLRCDAIIISLH